MINTFTQTANNERCTFLGNVSVGKDVSIATLRKAYTGVVMVSPGIRGLKGYEAGRICLCFVSCVFSFDEEACLL